MKNSKLRRALLLVACAVLLVSISVSATLAYLTSKTEVVTNTFKVGNITIDLDETDVDLYGVKDGVAPVKANEYKLIPGHTYTKDPTVHVAQGSEKCYVFVKVENEISDILAYQSVEQQMVDDATTEASNDGKWIAMGNNMYVYKEVVDASTAQVNLPTFTYFKVDGENVEMAPANDEDREDDKYYIEDYIGKTIKITAYAVQADGFHTTTYADNSATYYAEAEKAWNAGFGTN